MKARVTVDRAAQLVTRDGTVVGSLAGLSFDFDLDALGGLWGGSVSSSTNNNNPPTPKNEQTALLASPIEEVWAHYAATVPNGSRYKLDARRKRCVQKALAVRSVDQCKRAITELSRSAFHRGDNDRKTSYLDIEYALGKRGDSPDAVIDRWLERAGGEERTGAQAKLASLPSSQRHEVVKLMQRVRQALRSPDHAASVEAGRVAAEQLHKLGFEVKLRDDGSFGSWEVLP